MRKTRIVAVASLLLVGAAGCDLDVANTNSPDRERALANPADVQALVSGAWWNFYYPQHDYGISMSPALSNMSFQHAATAANFGMVDFSTIPRSPLVNETAWTNYGQFSGHWTRYYRAIAGVNAGLAAINDGVDLGNQVVPLQAYGRFVQGIAHGTVGMLFHEGPIVTEDTDLIAEQEFVGYPELLDAALGFLDEAIALSNANTFTIPGSWLGSMFGGREFTSNDLARMASSYKAMLRVSTPRSPAEADQVNWSAVLNEIENGVQSDVMLVMVGGSQFFGSLQYTLFEGAWSQTPYTVYGMADQSGAYQEWMGIPWAQRTPDLPSGRPFLIQTPDTRFPQGATLEEQIADLRPATEQRFKILETYGQQWTRPDRGTFRWSYYRDIRPQGFGVTGETPYISYREQRLLAAEAHYRLGAPAEAAAIINETRTAAGLNATDASGTNDSCVPRLADGSCGDLWEMLKWERRMEATHEAHYLMNTMYFDGRRWGDLMDGTIISFPVPCRDAQLETGMACEDAAYASGTGTYGY